MTYTIIVCSKCGGYLLAKNSQKTRTCPYCGSKISLEKALKIAKAENAYKAAALIRKLKEKKAHKQKSKASK
ncbi:MAG: DUF1922 domain-containing protein [Candidatus Bathyarchaeia archaeon]